MFVARFSHNANVREICDDTPTRDIFDISELRTGVCSIVEVIGVV